MFFYPCVTFITSFRLVVLQTGKLILKPRPPTTWGRLVHSLLAHNLLHLCWAGSLHQQTSSSSSSSQRQQTFILAVALLLLYTSACVLAHHQVSSLHLLLSLHTLQPQQTGHLLPNLYKLRLPLFFQRLWKCGKESVNS